LPVLLNNLPIFRFNLVMIQSGLELSLEVSGARVVSSVGRGLRRELRISKG